MIDRNDQSKLHLNEITLENSQNRWVIVLKWCLENKKLIDTRKRRL